MILCNSSDRIAKLQRAEARRRRFRLAVRLITWPLRLRIKVTLATDPGQKETPSQCEALKKILWHHYNRNQPEMKGVLHGH